MPARIQRIGVSRGHGSRLTALVVRRTRARHPDSRNRGGHLVRPYSNRRRNALRRLRGDVPGAPAGDGTLGPRPTTAPPAATPPAAPAAGSAGATGSAVPGRPDRPPTAAEVARGPSVFASRTKSSRWIRSAVPAVGGGWPWSRGSPRRPPSTLSPRPSSAAGDRVALREREGPGAPRGVRSRLVAPRGVTPTRPRRQETVHPGSAVGGRCARSATRSLSRHALRG